MIAATGDFEDRPLELISTPDNPIPGEPVVVQVTAADGFGLRAAYWGAEAPRHRLHPAGPGRVH